MTINLTAGNPGLLQLKAINSKNVYVNIPLASLPRKDREELVSIFPAITFGEQLDEMDSPMTVHYNEDGSYKRSYPLGVMVSVDGEICTRLGKKIVPLDLDSTDFDFELVTLERYEDPSLVFTFNDIELPMPLRLTKEAVAEFKDNAFKGIKKLIKAKDFETLKGYLMVAKEVSSSSGDDIELVDIQDLPEYTNIKVLEAKKVNVSFGVSFLLTVEVEGNTFKVWSPYTVREFLSSGATVGDDTVMQYFMSVSSTGKPRVNCNIDGLVFPETEDSAHIDLAMFA